MTAAMAYIRRIQCHDATTVCRVLKMHPCMLVTHSNSSPFKYLLSTLIRPFHLISLYVQRSFAQILGIPLSVRLDH